ncbi:MAG: sensor histidine kinase efflux regulator BaeS [Acinetobacter sp.]|uniref:sensor histidine kinase efflux regulator BaeS n=1 Tax=Acinetobacter sp. TaxID=472 RepID=UPI000F9B36EE|nr:sensor histidine kinase efflux regulator BaeS [Acinetobacter sp.]MBP9786924.1 sensor histidine kinase efflux regulator BaeS [Acinetobacter sp.]RUP38184.1 MAG: sensor histidine kinase efflux regulator BaeS [Acinetobacter sp.]
MNVRRVPLALRLFLTVLLTTLVIATISLGVLHWTMQKNFARYVADVEMQKLDRLIANLGNVYTVYHDWGNAIQAQILQIEGTAAPDDYDRLSQWWLRRQYDIALQQRYFNDHTLLTLSPTLAQNNTEIKNRQLFNNEELNILKQNLPSEYQPFEGLRFPLSPAQFRLKKDDRSIKDDKGRPPLPPEGDPGKKRFVPIPDRLGLSSRLSLYDEKHQFIVGEPATDQISYRPIIVGQEVVGYLGLKPVLDQDDASSINFFSNQKRYLLLVYALTVLSSLVAALLMATYFKKPIQWLLNATSELTRGNYQHQVKIRRNDELGDLSNQINNLADILHQHEESRRQWVADTSHELKTPLAVLQAQIEAMQDGIRKATPEHLSAMMRQISSLKKLTQDLADLAQADAQQLKCYFAEVNPWDVVLQEVENFKSTFDQNQLEVNLFGEGTVLSLDLDRFKQIIVNLLGNCVRYTEQGGKIQIHTQQNEQQWIMYVDDSPFGVSDEQLAHLGERFYRVDDSRTRSTGGTGLGLALSCKLAQALGGSLTFDHSPLGGLRCVLTFPKPIK